MWDDPVALNRVTKALLACTVLFVLWVAGRAMLEMRFPFRQVTVLGAQHADTRNRIPAQVRHMRGGFFSMDLVGVQAGFQALPWVRRVDVHRVWPGRLVISLEEHKAAAAWNDRASLNDHGEVFPVEPAPLLPRIYAPDGMEKLLARRYVEFSQTVAPLNLRVEQVVVTARQSWRVRLTSRSQGRLRNDLAPTGSGSNGFAAPGTQITGGITVELGRERINERLGRFAQAYPRAVAAVGPFQRADMRYPNGFAAQVEPRTKPAHKASKA